MSLSPTEQILEKLISFTTVSRDSNLELIHYVQDYLDSLGIESQLIFDDKKNKANLHARFGPDDVPGVMLSGHTDVVPIDGQDWNFNPFSMVEQNDRLYGRGATDMKGFIASVLALLPAARNRRLSRPIHLALSYDEEIGCVGVRRMIDMLETAPEQPAFCIIGEPTEMQVAIAHKGKTAAECVCRGVEAHSALVDRGLNAIYLATEMIQAIRGVQETLKLECEHDHHYSVPYTSLHVGTIVGGTALNIVPRECSFRFEIRNLHKDDPDAIVAKVQKIASDICADYRQDFPDMDINVGVINQYPALDTSPEEEPVKLLQRLLGTDDFTKLAFGTEGGLFQRKLGIPTVVCGPGSMDQGHKPDEFVTREQLQRCDQFLAALLDHISVP
jgi:acetylornithine deacetylase